MKNLYTGILPEINKKGVTPREQDVDFIVSFLETLTEKEIILLGYRYVDSLRYREIADAMINTYNHKISRQRIHQIIDGVINRLCNDLRERQM